MDLATSRERLFSVLLSAAEELEPKREEQAWDNEGGHVGSTAGRIERAPGCNWPCKAVPTRDPRECTEDSIAAMHEGEALIRRKASPSRRTLHIV